MEAVECVEGLTSSRDVETNMVTIARVHKAIKAAVLLPKGPVWDTRGSVADWRLCLGYSVEK